MKINIISCAAALLLSCTAAFAGSDNSTAMSFSRVDLNNVTSGMAGAGMASSQLSWGAMANPSSMVFSKSKFDVNAGWTSWMPKDDGANIIGASAGFSTSRMAFSVAFGNLTWKAYDIYSSTGAKQGTYSPKDMEMALGAAFKIGKSFSVGVNASYMSSSLTQKEKINGFSAGLFGTYSKNALSVSAGLRELGSKVEGCDLPTSALVAGAYDFTLGKSSVLKAVADFDYFLTGGVNVAAGAEFAAQDRYFVRAGYRFASDNAPVGSYASVGAGLKLKGIMLNLSYVLVSDNLAGSMSVGLGYRF